MGKHNNDDEGYKPNYEPLGSNSANAGSNKTDSSPDPSKKNEIQAILKEFYEKNSKKEIEALKGQITELKKDIETLKEGNTSLSEKNKGLVEQQAKVQDDLKKYEIKVDALTEEIMRCKDVLKKIPIESDYSKAHPHPDKWAYFHFVIMGDKDKTKRFSPNPNNEKNDELFKNGIGSKEPEAIKKWLKAEADDDEPNVDHKVITKPCWIDPETNEAKEVLTPEERKYLGLF